jgi:hypothetical protein
VRERGVAGRVAGVLERAGLGRQVFTLALDLLDQPREDGTGEAVTEAPAKGRSRRKDEASG